MDGIRIHKRKNGIMLLVLLLSFFCVMHNGRDEYLTHGGDEWEQSVSAADGTEVSRGTEWLLEGQYHFGDEYRTPPRVTGTPDVWCFFAETLLYGTLFGGMALINPTIQRPDDHIVEKYCLYTSDRRKERKCTLCIVMTNMWEETGGILWRKRTQVIK